MSRADASEQAQLEEYGIERLRKPSWEPKDEKTGDTGSRVQCNNCENSVTKQFARVFGDNNNEINSCPECGSQRERKTGAVNREGPRYE